MFSLFFRGMILYILMILTMRALGKRQMGQYQPYEFAMALLLADVISAPMESVSTPLLHGILPVAAMFIVHSVITLLSMRSDKVRAFISGKPTMVISGGVIDRQALDKLCLSLSDLLEGLRAAGILDPAQAGTAILEANGALSAFPPSSQRPPSAQEMNVAPPYEGLPMILIMDGRVQQHNLKQAGKDEAWLAQLLSQQNLTQKQVYLASLDTQGKLLIQDKQSNVQTIQAIQPQEVTW